MFRKLEFQYVFNNANEFLHVKEFKKDENLGLIFGAYGTLYILKISWKKYIKFILWLLFDHFCFQKLFFSFQGFRDLRPLNQFEYNEFQFLNCIFGIFVFIIILFIWVIQIHNRHSKLFQNYFNIISILQLKIAIEK